MNLEKIKRGLFNALQNDTDLKQIYNNKVHNVKDFSKVLKRTINIYCRDFNIYLDAPYLDCCYVRIDDCIINTDSDFIELFKNEIDTYLEPKYYVTLGVFTRSGCGDFGREASTKTKAEALKAYKQINLKQSLKLFGNLPPNGYIAKELITSGENYEVLDHLEYHY